MVTGICKIGGGRALLFKVLAAALTFIAAPRLTHSAMPNRDVMRRLAPQQQLMSCTHHEGFLANNLFVAGAWVTAGQAALENDVNHDFDTQHQVLNASKNIETFMDELWHIDLRQKQSIERLVDKVCNRTEVAHTLMLQEVQEMVHAATVKLTQRISDAVCALDHNLAGLEAKLMEMSETRLMQTAGVNDSRFNLEPGALVGVKTEPKLMIETSNADLLEKIGEAANNVIHQVNAALQNIETNLTSIDSSLTQLTLKASSATETAMRQADSSLSILKMNQTSHQMLPASSRQVLPLFLRRIPPIPSIPLTIPLTRMTSPFRKSIRRIIVASLVVWFVASCFEVNFAPCQIKSHPT